MSSLKDGFTDHEILLKIWDALDLHIQDGATNEKELRRELARRPTRTEIAIWVSGIGTLTGVLVAFGF